MGTLNRSVNFFKGFFNRVKNLFKKEKPTQFDKPQFTLPTMMTRKYRGPARNRKRLYHGNKAKQYHHFGGCRSHESSSSDCIYIPKRTKQKGYVKDAQAHSTFNKHRRAS